MCQNLENTEGSLSDEKDPSVYFGFLSYFPFIAS